MAGPEALPTAETLVANPFKVPRIRRLKAEFVMRMVEQGKAKMTATHLKSIMAIITACWVVESWISAVKGVIMYTNGKTMAQVLRQVRTPYLFATGGKIRNWTKQPNIPYKVNIVPMRSLPRPKPPENLKGNAVLLSSGTCFGRCIKIGSN